MKFCMSCGGQNATGAAFCQHCGASFRVIDGESATRNDGSKDAPETDGVSGGSIQTVEPSPRHDDAFGAATKEFATVVGASALAVFVAFAQWLYRLARPLVRAACGFFWGQVKTAFSPASTWNPEYVPNFLIWGVVGAFLWRLPTSLVGIVYAILANEARRAREFELAQTRAESAKNWLIADFVVGLVVCVFRNLVL